MENWPDDFVPSALQQDIICLDETDLDERAGYSEGGTVRMTGKLQTMLKEALPKTQLRSLLQLQLI
ncbi:hypothetical protein N7530_008916 [Penicillium desertorum]|uniref:Uncharacterized protein n=1 Tax=Penicillium desertorum TaxID=1303715 RepID=A0A9W9WQ41_9EURO|nr:hypothetical protein N7530_008916 [Penicillium desertorum]